jgi:hypothetical protein
MMIFYGYWHNRPGLPNGIFPYLGKFWRVLQWKMLEYFIAISFFWPFGIFYGYLVIISHFGMFYQEKSGNPGTDTLCCTMKAFRGNCCHFRATVLAI